MITRARLIRVWRSHCLVVIATLCTVSSSASAATLNVVGGQLVGAYGVDVFGILYDVEFMGGTCIELFNGCDDAADFLFPSLVDGNRASSALLGQVFLDSTAGQFDSSPWLTAGCERSNYTCIVVTPINWISPGRWGSHAGNTLAYDFVSFDDEFSDYSRTVDLSLWAGATYAVWSVAPVPEPSTAILLGIGLVGLAVKRKRLN